MSKRPVRRESNALIFDQGKMRPVIIQIDPQLGLLTFRLKGTKRAYSLPASYLYLEACRRHVSLEKARKAKEKAERRKARAK